MTVQYHEVTFSVYGDNADLILRKAADLLAQYDPDTDPEDWTMEIETSVAPVYWQANVRAWKR